MLLLSLLSCSVVFVFFGSTCASPVPSNTKYDQRQEGEWNVRADLENFVILIIPTTSGAASGTSPASASLLDLLSKAVPHRGHNKRIKHLKKDHQHHHETENVESPVNTEHFIESKTAPYHVDISRSRAKLHPHIDDFSVTKKPFIKGQESGLVQPHKRPMRLSKAYIVTVPEVLETLKKEITKSEPKKSVGVAKKDLKKKVDKVFGEKVGEGSLVEEKPAHEKFVEVKPVEEKPAEVKPVEEKLVEEKPIQETPVEEKPVEDKPVEEKPVEQKPAEEKPVEQKPAEEKPVEQKPVEEKPVKPIKDHKPLGDKPVETMKLLGAENEQCGPGLRRDSYGICRIVPE